MPKRRRRFLAQPEVLEQRALLSNVTVTFKSGNLTIKGDSGDNQIVIRDSEAHGGSGGIRIDGAEGTTVNGASSFQLPVDTISNDVKLIFSRGGNNAVFMQADVGDDVFFKGGRGIDFFQYSGEVGDLSLIHI